jgi:hypothetical protein
MCAIYPILINKATGWRKLIGTGNPNTIGLICPIGSEFTDQATGTLYISKDDETSDWAALAEV